jgi:hypothetical protein
VGRRQDRVLGDVGHPRHQQQPALPFHPGAAGPDGQGAESDTGEPDHLRAEAAAAAGGVDLVPEAQEHCHHEGQDRVGGSGGRTDQARRAQGRHHRQAQHDEASPTKAVGSRDQNERQERNHEAQSARHATTWSPRPAVHAPAHPAPEA